jgi:hypothetical protein
MRRLGLLVTGLPDQEMTQARARPAQDDTT